MSNIIILLIYNFKMDAYADGLSRLIPKRSEPLEEMVIASLKEEKELSEILGNTLRELPVILEGIKKAAKTNEFIIGMKKQVRWNEKKKKVERCRLFQFVTERWCTQIG